MLTVEFQRCICRLAGGRAGRECRCAGAGARAMFNVRDTAYITPDTWVRRRAPCRHTHTKCIHTMSPKRLHNIQRQSADAIDRLQTGSPNSTTYLRHENLNVYVHVHYCRWSKMYKNSIYYMRLVIVCTLDKCYTNEYDILCWIYRLGETLRATCLPIAFATAACLPTHIRTLP